MDDRGYGESGGTYAGATSQDFAEDIRAGLQYLRTRPEIDGARLGLVGHSEGGMIAPLVAVAEPSLKGIVLLAGPAFKGRPIIESQQRYAIERDSSLNTPAKRDSALARAGRGLDSLMASEPWMHFFLAYDPLETARKVRVPVLILQGATDRQVSADQAPALERAFKEGGDRSVTMRVFSGTNHLFLTDPDGNPAGYPKLAVSRVRPEVVGALVDWLVKMLAK
jgi:dienelactone hydrolase